MKKKSSSFEDSGDLGQKEFAAAFSSVAKAIEKLSEELTKSREITKKEQADEGIKDKFSDIKDVLSGGLTVIGGLISDGIKQFGKDVMKEFNEGLNKVVKDPKDIITQIAEEKTAAGAGFSLGEARYLKESIQPMFDAQDEAGRMVKEAFAGEGYLSNMIGLRPLNEAYDVASVKIGRWILEQTTDVAERKTWAEQQKNEQKARSNLTEGE